MSTAQELDYTTLKWVKDEIDESLKQTRQALEAYVENPEDKTQIRFCATYLHQIYGTLQMVEIYGGALLAEEMELLSNALLNGKVTVAEDAYEVLMRSILQLPSYLEHIEQGHPDQPVILLPLLNDLRSARDEHLLSDSAFFSPSLDVTPPPEPIKPDKKKINLNQYGKKLRTVYQACLVGLYRNSDTKGNLKKIGAVLREMSVHSTNENSRRLWWVATGVVEALLEKGLDLSNSLKQIIGQLDKEIKLLIDKGEDVYKDKHADDLTKNLLYYIATSKSNGKRVRQIKQAFDLENALPSSGDVSESFESLRGSSQELMRSVSAVIKEDLLQIKDQLDIFVRATQRDVATLEPLGGQMRRIADTLAMLGLGDLRKIAQEQLLTIDELCSGNKQPNDVTLMEIASALLYIESSLEGVETKTHGGSGKTLPAGEQVQLNKLVIAEASEVLTKVKESFNTFATDSSQKEKIADTPDQLGQVRGVMSVLAFDHAASLLQAAIQYIRKEIIDTDQAPDQKALDAVADVITSIEYYLEAVVDSRKHADSLLSVAVKSLTELGYNPDEAAVTTSTDTDFGELEIEQDVAEEPPLQLAESAELSLEPEPETVEPRGLVLEDTPAPSAEEDNLTLEISSSEELSLEPDVDEGITWNTDTDSSLAGPSFTLEEPGLSLEDTNTGMEWASLTTDEPAVDDSAFELSSQEMEEPVQEIEFNAEIDFQDSPEALSMDLDGSSLSKSDDLEANPDRESLDLGSADSLESLDEDSLLLEIPEDTEAMDLQWDIPNDSIELQDISVDDALDFSDSLEIDEPIAIEPMKTAAETPTVALEITEEQSRQLQMAPSTPVVEDDIDEEILEIFIEEADEVVVVMRINLDNWRQNNDSDALATLRRSYHTIKGSGRLAGAMEIGEFAWAIESMLNQVIEGQLEPSPVMFELLDNSQIALDCLISKLKGEVNSVPSVQGLVDTANALAVGKPVADVPPYSADGTSKITDSTAAQIAELEQVSQEIESELSEAEPDETQDNVLQEIFRKETETHLKAIGNYLDNFKPSKKSFQDGNLMRALHTLHGSARMADAKYIASLAERLDRHYNTLSESGQPATAHMTDVLEQAHAMLSDMAEHTDDPEYKPEGYSDLIHQAENMALDHGVKPDFETENFLQEEDSFQGLTPLDINDIQPETEEIQLSDPLGDFAMESIELQEPTLQLDLDDGDLSLNDLIESSTNEELRDNTLELSIETVAPDATQQLARPGEDQLFSMDDHVDEELLEIFLEEAQDILANIEDSLSRWSSDLNSEDIIAELQRSLHTLKGGARMADINPLADIAHGIESLLEQIIEGNRVADAALESLVRDCMDWLAQTVDKIKQRGSFSTSGALLARIEAFTHGTASDEAIGVDPIVEESDSGTMDIVIEEAKTIEMKAPQFPEDDFGPIAPENELLNLFLEEANEIQQQNADILSQLQENPQERNHLSKLHQSYVRLEDGAHSAHLHTVVNLAQAIEHALISLDHNGTDLRSIDVQLFRRCHEWLNSALVRLRNFQELQQPQALLDELQQLSSPQEAMDDYGIDSEAISLTADEDEPEEITLQSLDGLDDMDFSISEPVATLDLSDDVYSDDEIDEELVDIFIEEAEEIQETNDRILSEWEQNIGNRELILELQRSLHTLKGGARMAGLSSIGDLSHAIESLLEGVTESGLTPTADFPKIIHACQDWLSKAIEQVKKGQTTGHAAHLIHQLENLLAQKPLEPLTQEIAIDIAAAEPEPELIMESELEPIPDPEPVTAKTMTLPAVDAPMGELIQLPGLEKGQFDPNDRRQGSRNVEEQIRVRADLIDNLVNYAGEANIFNSRIGQQLNAWRFNLAELNQTVNRLEGQLRKFEIETEAQIMYRHADITTETEEDDEDFDPLELDRFSYMQQLSRGMVESLGDLTSIQNLLENISGDTDVLLLQQSRIHTDLQEGLMRTRLTPFSSVLARLRRIVRQTCQETNREAGLTVTGAEGEMDRTQLNRIVPALEHILRNAIAHGIESETERKKAGKPAAGTIEIQFSREGSEVVLKIVDDGAGMNIQALRNKAIERGLITKKAKLSDQEIMEFILQSGFSTATEITQISGRGVGMDVVNTEIKQLNGSLHIDSNYGSGTTFTVRLPLTVLINQALMVTANECNYAIQMSNVEHVVRIRGDELNRLLSGQQEHYDYAGQQYEPLSLNQILHNLKADILENKTTYPVLLARSGDHRIAIHVDQLIGRQEIVIKSLGPQLSSVDNISGATILPNGEIALILDISTLIRSNLALQQADEPVEFLEAPQKVTKPVVMVVDDSITVRKVTQRLLTRNDMDSITAKDGVDALTVLMEQIPDVMLLDIEMPRMDGYELATAIRNDPRLKHIPIIMITSRAGDKHRDRAMSIGVNMYMSKPFQETDLLNNIRTLIDQ
ncbi:MAG: Hpt domain-containing protein [Gammaproteobacteria bacterium]|nr:Hpt domain-containing protein [Gammaproteobacteria bacterium]